MDFDDRFDLDEFRNHFQALDLVDSEADIHDLIRRTTSDTRGGDAFSFKPTHMWIGSGSPHQFSSGFDCAVEPKGPNPQKMEATDLFSNDGSAVTGEVQPSSFWIRFGGAGERFDFRMFCQGQDIPSLRPYEGILPFRNVIAGGVELRAQRKGGKVIAHLTIRSTRPPRLIVRLVPVLPGKNPIYDRQVTEADFFAPAVNESDAGIISPLGDSDRALIKIGLWLTHRFEFCLTIRQYKLFWQCMVRLRFILSTDLPMRTNLAEPLRLVHDWPVGLSGFEMRYLVEGLISHGNVSEGEVGRLYTALRPYRPSLWASILEGLFKKPRTQNMSKDVTDVARRTITKRPVKPHYVIVRRCLVTPTRCLAQPPQEETSNSMLRAYSDYKDRFLRVQFVDEDDALRVSTETLSIDEKMEGGKGIFARLRRALRFGVHISGRDYVFLCFGESQIKERGCWMISEINTFTVRNILHWMGNLTEERIIAKHAARQGLALSTTREVDIQLDIRHDLPDITTTQSGARYTFTDGVGHCTQALVDRCAFTLGHGLSQANPSAAQVRIGGSKGVLTVVHDNAMKENTARLRKSMIKFKSNNQKLNVLQVASHGVAYLNRQAILLLEAQGVPSQVLLEIFEEEKVRIKGLEQTFDSEGLEQTFDSEGLEQTFDSEHLATFTSFPLARAVSTGFAEDPLVQNMLRVLKCRLLSDLKWKARIPIPDGAYLMGVADETNTLLEGQIFCQIDCPFGRQVITGSCMIYRNPCLHPGDIRLVKAVDHHALSHLKNVVVFPTVGARDLPSMMGGGDLDGDHYTVLWDERLLIPCEHEPGDYTPPRPIQVAIGKTITVEDTKEFWLHYIMNDILGMICNAHMALADEYEEGPRHPDCLYLADLASRAVDFSKTGVPVHRSLDLHIRPEAYPDFMGKEEEMAFKSEKKNKAVRTRKSKKVLGEMFRSIDSDPVFKSVKTEDAWHHPFDDIPSTHYQPYLFQAGLLKIRYDFELNGLLRLYNICEAECVAGVLLRSRKRRIRNERDYSLRVAVREAYSELVSTFDSEAVEYLNAHPIMGSKAADRRAWALACYKVTYDASYSRYSDIDWTDIELVGGQAVESDETEDSDEEGADDLQANTLPASEKRYSFPWLFHEEIFLLKEGGLFADSTIVMAS